MGYNQENVESKEVFTDYEPFEINQQLPFDCIKIEKVGYRQNGNPVLYKFYRIQNDGYEQFKGNFAVRIDYEKRVKVETKPYTLVIRACIFDENGWRFDKMVFKIVKFANEIDYQYPYELKKELYGIVEDDVNYRFGALSIKDKQTVNQAISDWVDNYLEEIGG